jgi:hypothetical protein
MSALPPKADITKPGGKVRFVPEAHFGSQSSPYDPALLFSFWRGRKAHEMRSDAKPATVPPFIVTVIVCFERCVLHLRSLYLLGASGQMLRH